MEFIKRWFKESGPLSSKRIHRELNGHSVHGRHIITGADKSNFGDMIVYYINRNKYNSTPVIYLHGGAYLHGLNPLHFKFCHSLSNIIKSPVVLLDYPLLPDENHEVAYEKVLKYLDQFENYILIGDSAGGGLALGCHLHQKLNNKPLPKKTILMSPWVDVTMSTPEISHLESLDFVLNRETLIEIGQRWANDKETTHYMVSPTYGDCEALENIMLISGDEELFTPDLRKLSKRLNKENCLYIEGKNMFHDYILFTNMGLQTADDTFTEIIKFLKDIPNS
ncbi:alpha/beta hydrolase [Acidaminobacter sp. JC074]|uniref:alpha/beta hydrolase fold domain-containing protein n=1 Tax=Acidaminobacter sp. JC074 TaxID=2530199 RepID=UPI001F0D2086|nr:alpha/beta hydrolase [Acidaminobacter sp. JC074]MCH4887822.1 alpha/beta hydrolase [Acidaminobacter sp. JC074]